MRLIVTGCWNGHLRYARWPGERQGTPTVPRALEAGQDNVSPAEERGRR